MIGSNLNSLDGANAMAINKIIIFMQKSIIYACLVLFIFLILSVILNNTVNKTNKFTFLFNVVKFSCVALICLVFLLVFTKFIIYLWNFKTYAFCMSTYLITKFKLDYIVHTPVISFNGSILSDVIILLGFSSGIISIYLLGEKNLSKNLHNVSIFSSFLLATVIMVYTTNLLVMFVGFECLFVPTLYFVYRHGYVDRLDRTLRILFYWTLCGAFLVLSSLGYLYFKYKTLNYSELTYLPFSTAETTLMYLFIFLGFGVKVPIFPFHYWLTKIHVEAPAGFSVFLSGFLVKAAIFCFYYLNIIFQTKLASYLVTTVAFFGIVDASVKMWTQTDFKKLIAYATIQEMNLILFLLINVNNIMDYSIILFVLIHGWLSTLMFFLVDIIQKKTSTRNIVEVSGLAHTFPGLKFIIWFIIILFGGFPLTVKFIIEWQILGTFVVNSTKVMIFVVGFVIVFGVVGFVKQWMIVLYGLPKTHMTINSNLTKKDKYLFFLIIMMLVLLNLLNLFLG